MDMTERDQWIAALREVADWLDYHPEVPTPTSRHSIQLWAGSKEELAVIVRALGNATKHYDGEFFTAEGMFGPICVYVGAVRETVCRKVVKGVETVTEQVPVEYETREVVREIVEWECEPILAVEKS